MAIIAVGLPSALFAQEFEVTGVLYSTSFRPNSPQTVWNTNAVEYTMARKGRQWWLKQIIHSNAKSKTGAKFNEMGCDGVDRFKLSYFTDEAIENTKKLLQGKNQEFRFVRNSLNEHLFAFPGIFPAREPVLGKVIWLAYASDTYLGLRAQSRTVPNFFTFHDDAPHKFSVQPLKSPGLPAQFTLFNPGHYLLPAKDGKRPPYPAPFDREFVMSKFRTLSSTNLNGMQIPVQFEFRHELPVFDGKQWKLALQFLITNSVSRIVGTSSRESVLPEITGLANMVDRRFAEHKNIVFFTNKSKTWLNRNDPQINEKLQALDPKKAASASDCYECPEGGNCDPEGGSGGGGPST